MRINEIESKKASAKSKKLGKIIPIAAALAAILAVSAAAVGFIRSGFYQNAFGTGIEGSEGGTKDLYDADGNYVKTFDEPAVERVEADPELAEELIGDAVANVGETVTVGEYTVTVDEYVFDENGMGMVSALISHPEGHVRYNDEWYFNTDRAFCHFENFEYAGEGTPGFPFFSSKEYTAKEESTETDFRVIYYVSQLEADQETDDIDYVFNAATPLARSITTDQIR